MSDTAAAKKPTESMTEMVQVVLPNDANPLGYILGGTVMHLIDIAGAIACHRHTRSPARDGGCRWPAVSPSHQESAT